MYRITNKPNEDMFRLIETENNAFNIWRFHKIRLGGGRVGVKR